MLFVYFFVFSLFFSLDYKDLLRSQRVYYATNNRASTIRAFLVFFSFLVFCFLCFVFHFIPVFSEITPSSAQLTLNIESRLFIFKGGKKSKYGSSKVES